MYPLSNPLPVDVQVEGHSNAFFNGIYKKEASDDWTLQQTYPEKSYFKGPYFELYYGADQVKELDNAGNVIPCAGRW
jgi:hypothetical protein